MKRRKFVISTFSSAIGLLVASDVTGQKKPAALDLAELFESKSLNVFNRTVTRLNDGTRKGIRLNEGQGEGLAYLKGVEFGEGTIEFDVSGKDVPQQSFVGIAFHGVDEKTYDAVYFRPFNFRTEDPARRIRAVQYISRPLYTWQKLRTEHPGRYEKPVSPVPDPNGWFHARVVVKGSRVSVFVEDGKEPSLVVDQLSNRKQGLVGVWVDVSGGDFANLTIA